MDASAPAARFGESGGAAPHVVPTPVLGGHPIACIDVSGQVIDVTRRGVNARKAAGVVDLLGDEEVDARYAHYRVTSDAAQVVACYLRCHPKVECVRYPGLKDDPSFPVASVTLQGGFGPIVDYQVAGVWQRFEATEDDVRTQVMALEEALRREDA